ncbi:MBL fold metallo-hydrolase [Pilimelia columellifera]|uniref:MBL fold metallo-hydrolase n=1 Tax=Pilimelia columellifera subsp. columellifera TaxID=706583 RepID=A0ABP6AI31_9ACTN
MDITTFRTPGLGDTTYLLTHNGRGVLVDPQRDFARFLEAAAEKNVELRFVLETHLHNDYVSGGPEAARRTGAELVMPAAAAPAYRHTPAFHLEDIGAEDGLSVRPIHTPGHTPEHTSYLVLIDGEPVAVFSGGSLLVASAGRPDLLGPARADTLARLQHRSLHRLAGLPRDVLLLPTHGEGSFCTTSGVGRFTSTIGDEVDGNPLLALPTEDAFAAQLMATPLPIPAFYPHMGPTNIAGVPPMPATSVPALTLADLATLPDDARIVDIRPRHAVAKGRLPGSTAIELGTDFGSWTGWLLPYGAPLVLVAEPGQDVAEAITQLAQIGLDAVLGVVTDLDAAATATFEVVELDMFVKLVQQPDAQILDVRMPSEHREIALPGAVWRFLPELFSEGVPTGLDSSRPVLVACGSGRRATIAASLLTDAGYRPVVLSGAGVAELAQQLAR